MLAKAEANVVVAIGGIVVVAIGAAQVHRFVVPTAAAQHAVGAAVVPSLHFYVDNNHQSPEKIRLFRWLALAKLKYPRIL